MGAFSSGERGIEVAHGEVDLGEGVPRGKRIGGGKRGVGQFLEGGIGVTDGVVGGGILDERLKFVAGHGGEGWRCF